MGHLQRVLLLRATVRCGHDLSGREILIHVHQLRVHHPTDTVGLLRGVEEAGQRRLLRAATHLIRHRRHVRLQDLRIRVHPVRVHHQQQRGVHAGAEAFRHQIRGLTLRGVQVGGGVRRQRHLQPQHRGGHGAKRHNHHGHHQRREAAHKVHPVAAHGPLVEVLASNLGNAPGERLVAPRAKQCWQHGQRHQHGDEHRKGGGHAHPGQELDAGEHQRNQRDKHCGAGEHHGTTCRAHRHTGRIRATASLPLLAVTRQDKQRVINTHRKTNHHRQNRGDVIELHPMRGGQNSQRADAHAHNRGHDGHSGRRKRAERDQQHQKRNANTDQL